MMKNLDSTRTNRGPKPWVVLKFGISKMKIPWFTDVYIYIYMCVCVITVYTIIYIYTIIYAHIHMHTFPPTFWHISLAPRCAPATARGAKWCPSELLRASPNCCWKQLRSWLEATAGWIMGWTVRKKMAGKWLEKPEHLCCVFDDFLLCSCSHLFRDAVKSPFFSRRPGSSPRFEV